MLRIGEDSPSARVRGRLNHPVVDADAHWLESIPVFFDYLRNVGGQSMVDDLLEILHAPDRWYAASPEERRKARMGRANSWQGPGLTLDRATSMIPRLMHERLDEFGIDFAIVYPTLALGGFQFEHRSADFRRCCVRAYNTMVAEMFRPYRDRITAAGIIPTVTPQEGIDEAEYMVRELDLKVGMLRGTLQRTVEADAEWQPDPSKRRHYFDCLAMDSPYDFDPLWAKMVELGLAYTTHAGTMGDTASRSSPSSVVFSRVGHFAQAHHAAAKGLFLGGVTQRFPQMNFAFLEAGVAWAVNTFTDLVLIWEKLSRPALEKNLRPANLDQRLLRQLFGDYATDEPLRGNVERIFAENHLFPYAPYRTPEELTERDSQWDEFAAITVNGREDIRRLFVDNFYFGAESDDPTIRWAFDEKTTEARFKPIFSSDISHFDVTDMREVLEEAWELVEHELIDESAFRELTFSNAVALHGRMNPNFFKGTRVETAAAEELARLKK
ncbi:MAG: amidohydrolase family protein [Chloroflexota bacterium]|nr:amidohydrolase family protein [Chloroflexota bacterium]